MLEKLRFSPLLIEENCRPSDRIQGSLRRYYVDEFHFRHIPQLSDGSLVLDLGGKKIGKRGQFNIDRYNFRVVYVNTSAETHPDVVADAANLPFEDSHFDAVICSELLEHVPQPLAVVREAHRVLRPGGTILICVPFLYRIHADPYDFGRYTDYYWQSILQEIGFKDIVIEQQGLFFSVIADFAKQYVSEIGFPRPFGRIAFWVIDQFQKWALKHERKSQIQANPFLTSFTTGYGIVAVKP